MPRKKRTEVLRPFAEIVVRINEVEACTVAFFDAPKGGYDVLCGLQDISERAALEQLFQYAATALHEAEFAGLSADDTSGSLPF